MRGREGGSGIREVSRAWLLETCGLWVEYDGGGGGGWGGGESGAVYFFI